MVDEQVEKLRVAIVHDALLEYGGAVKVVEAFLEIFPKADIYTGLVGKSFPEGLIKKRVRKCLSSPFLFMGRNAFSKLLVQVYWESLNLSEYDLVISSSD